jgi:hypothetical protein
VDVILAELALIAGAVYAGVKRLYVYVAAFVAGAFLLAEEAIRNVSS